MKSGVYKISNKINGKFYIGSSVNIHKRWITHKCDLNKKRHANRYLQNVNNKHGFDCFLFKVIEYCSIENLQSREQYYIDTLKPEYNLFKTAYSVKGKDHPMFGRKHNKEARLKIKEARSKQIIKHSEDTRNKISESNKGKKIDINHIKKMVQARGGTSWNKGLKLPTSRIHVLSEKTINGIVKDYKNGLSINKIKDNYNISWKRAKQILIENNITTRTISQEKKLRDERRIKKTN